MWRQSSRWLKHAHAGVCLVAAAAAAAGVAAAAAGVAAAAAGVAAAAARVHAGRASAWVSACKRSVHGLTQACFEDVPSLSTHTLKRPEVQIPRRVLWHHFATWKITWSHLPNKRVIHRILRQGRVLLSWAHLSTCRLLGDSCRCLGSRHSRQRTAVSAAAGPAAACAATAAAEGAVADAGWVISAVAQLVASEHPAQGERGRLEDL